VPIARIDICKSGRPTGPEHIGIRILRDCARAIDVAGVPDLERLAQGNSIFLKGRGKANGDQRAGHDSRVKALQDWP
jgi:hypothetical protein